MKVGKSLKAHMTETDPNEEGLEFLMQKMAESTEANVNVTIQVGDQVFEEAMVAPAHEVQRMLVDLMSEIAKDKEKSAKVKREKTRVGKTATLAARKRSSSTANTSRPGSRRGSSLRPAQQLHHGAGDSSGESRAKDPSKAVFGVSLEEVVSRQAERDVPEFVEQGLQELLLRGLAVEGIFRLSGARTAVEGLKDAIDHGDPYDMSKIQDPNVIAALLKQYLRELPDPLLPYEKYDDYVALAKVQNAEEAKKRLAALVVDLADAPRNLLYRISTFMSVVAKNSRINMMNSSNCAIVLGPNILRKNVDPNDMMAQAAMAMESGDVNKVAEMFVADPFVLIPRAEINIPTFRWKLVGHKKSVLELVQFPEHDQVLTMDSDGSVQIWNSHETTFVSSFETGVRMIAAGRVGDNLWVVHQKGGDIRDHTGAQVAVINTPLFAVVEVNGQAWCATEGAVVVFDAQTFKEVKRIAIPCGLCFGFGVTRPAEGVTHVWGSGADNSIVVFDADSYELIKTIPKAHNRQVNGFCFAANQQVMYTVSDDGSLKVWSASTHEMLMETQAHESRAYDVILLRNQIWSCSWDKNISIRDPEDLSLLHNFVGMHTDAIRGIAYIQKEGVVWSFSSDRTISVWELPLLKKRKLPPTPI